MPLDFQSMESCIEVSNLNLITYPW